MSHGATVIWSRTEGQPFGNGRFDRAHDWSFDGGLTIRASSSPAVIPRFSDPAAIDPEEAFVASLAACHMMTFLYLASKADRIVDRYEDHAIGELARTPEGRIWLARVTLRPRVTWAGSPPDADTARALHDRAHQECFIANSVRTEIRCAPID